MVSRLGQGRYVWTVHTTLEKEVRPTEVIYTDERRACAHAAEMSRDQGVLAASVVRFTLDEPGTQSGIAMFVNGTRQQVPYVSDCRTIHGGGKSS